MSAYDGSMRRLAVLAFLILVSRQPCRGDDRPPLQCLDASGHVLASAASPRKVGGEIKRPEAIRRVSPDLTHARVSGVIIIETIIDRDGKVCAARLLSPKADRTAEAYLAALRQWRFSPATLKGRPVPVYYVLTVNVDPQ